ncbi:hypothetical protein HRbin15_00577 [bacterium HR15]|nr:hypothetical protein HRbin15_00577 [bacterium HR15]
MQRTIVSMGLVAMLGSMLYAQQPAVFLGARLRTQVRTDEHTTQLRWYDDLARHSVVSLQFYHEAGYGAYIAQRLQNIPRDRTRTALDEAYLEKLDGWRIGKFYVPFGAGLLLSESVNAVQLPTRFAIGNLPMRVAYLFNGKERQQGIYVRVGTANGGVAVGIGRHFGTDPHAFAAWELPESPRHPEGYQHLYGADLMRELGSHRLQLEWLYSGGNRMVDTHWFALRWQPLTMPLQPELLLTYQTASERLSWRLNLRQQLDEHLSVDLVVRGQQGTLQFMGIGLRGEL